MLRRTLLLICCTFSLFSLAAQEKIHELEEVTISDRSLAQIIKKVSSQLNRKIKAQSYPYPNFYGNARYEKIVESKGKAIQFDRDYGLFLTTGNVKHTEWDLQYAFRFYPVYSAYSFRLSNSGEDTLKFHYLTGGANYNKNFNSNSRKIFTAMRALTLYGPLFTSPSYYTYKLIDNSNNTYTIAFSPKKKYYLKKIRTLAYGTLQIDKQDLHLKSMQLEDFTYHHHSLVRKFNNHAQSPFSSRMNVRFSYEGENCYIHTCYLETHWEYPKNELYKAIEVASRPYPDRNKIVEKEAWQVENIDSFPHESDEIFRKSTTVVYGRYAEEVFKTPSLLTAAPQAIQDLNQYMDIEKQYQLFNYPGIWNDHTFDERVPYQAHLQRVPFTRILIQKLFKEPIQNHEIY
ncbi:MAG: hypothetical protein NC410_01570 [Oscillibacter sp.]|nr:hypothetical protein [Oscillibacter sp.]